MSYLNVTSFNKQRREIKEKFTAAAIVDMGDVELASLQNALGMGTEWGVWEVPKEYMPDGQMQGRNCRVCEILRRLAEVEGDVAQQKKACLEIIRYGVARSLVPAAKNLPKPSTIVTEVHILTRIARDILTTNPSKSFSWGLATQQDFLHKSNSVANVVRTLQIFKSRGIISDSLVGAPVVEGSESERDRYGEDDWNNTVENDKAWQPLPDRFVSECGWRSLHIIRELGPTLLDAVETALALPVAQRQDGNKLHRRREQLATATFRDAIIKNWDWRGLGGKPLDCLGYDLNIKSTALRVIGGATKLPFMEWPPETFSDAWSLLALLQGANLFPVCMASGPRASEVSSFTQDCLVEALAVGNRIMAKTYKLVGDAGGRDRDFAAPEAVVAALLLQIRLAKIVKARAGVEGDHLWIHIRSFGRGRMGEKQIQLSQFMDHYAVKLGVKKFLLPEAPKLHIHRFRKTLARIVALSLVNSPTILMDCFGHEDPNMTIRRYILSDKQIARDVLVVQRELIVLMAVDVISDSENLGGAVSEQLRKRKADYLQFLGKSEFEPQDAYEFAKRETFDGRSWIMVSPGIYCTLPQGEGGLCAKGQSGTNPAYCHSGCPFQLLTAYNKTKADDAVLEILKNLARAIEQDELMLVSQWAGQLKNWLHRWSDIEKKWQTHPLVQKYGGTNGEKL
ncbi:hypothetical protein [Pseudomonas canadensis]|uniref:hypothetical protein n=1 Tax=Pseudomonas canadensis TaxID=915099 RepID=UPI003BA38472